MYIFLWVSFLTEELNWCKTLIKRKNEKLLLLFAILFFACSGNETILKDTLNLNSFIKILHHCMYWMGR
ncbi:MAG: hypothetical protein CM15mP83_8050 [Flavobacteriaceae bacterium]|nr:MAG: hypothetical protein CM15mP83_8050 [Flavobacteriaceae bacterium]